MNITKHKNRVGALMLAALFFLATAGQTNTAIAKKKIKQSDKYRFENTISRKVLENYLDHSITMMNFMTGQGNFDDNLRMIQNMGAKFIGRAACQWANEDKFLANYEKEKSLSPKVHEADPEIILQACIFEIVSPKVNVLPIPEWIFKEMGLPVEKRNFNYEKMLYPDGQFVNHWGYASVPDVSQPETQLYFFYQAAMYIDAGFEAIHFGQVELMNKNDKNLDHYASLLAKIREYAKKHARRGMLICDAHVPSGGFLYKDNYLLMDFHSFPLRIKEVGEPEEAILEVGYTDAIYNRSKGGRTYSGWSCESLPYLVEFDNFGVSDKPGEKNAGGNFFWCWGYDEITWFANQSDEYRHKWLKYAYDWVAKTDPNGFLQMPAGRGTTYSKTKHGWYYGNNPSPAVPDGQGDEDVIKEIWKNGRTK